MEIVSSNRLEVLYEHFVKKISLKPFAPLTIVVPSTALREWLTFRLAKDKNILFGVEILLLEEALFKTASEKTPSLLALALTIEPKLDEIPEIREFLKSDKRRHTLACRLAKLFQKYSSNCPRMKKEWKKGWQAELFQKIFDKKPTLWEAVQPSAFYLFGISYLTPIEKKAFENAKIWMFSPCLHYWEDQLSEKEQASLLRYYEKKGVKD
ncbi:MAG: exodeoxyribonuclease V subunit gamma, partial [Parachlamydiaceae bacterium]